MATTLRPLPIQPIKPPLQPLIRPPDLVYHPFFDPCNSLALHPITENQPPQDVPMTLNLILGTVAQKGHPTPSGQLFHQAQRKLLAMVLNGSAALVDRAIKEKLFSILL